MKVVLVSGSPRKNGNCEKMLEISTTFFTDNNIDSDCVKLSEVTITPCIHCDFCKTNDYCSHDENANKVNAVLESADAIIFYTPVYFGGITGQLKSFIDKTLPLRRSGFKLKGKVVAAVAVGGSRCGGQELAINNIHASMLVHGAVIVGDNSHFGGTLHNPMEKDDFGSTTLKGVLGSVKEILQKLK